MGWLSLLGSLGSLGLLGVCEVSRSLSMGSQLKDPDKLNKPYELPHPTTPCIRGLKNRIINDVIVNRRTPRIREE
jgi:hypothetical protein